MACYSCRISRRVWVSGRDGVVFAELRNSGIDEPGFVSGDVTRTGLEHVPPEAELGVNALTVSRGDCLVECDCLSGTAKLMLN